VDGVIFSGLGSNVADLAVRIDRLRREEIFTVIVGTRRPIADCSSIAVDHTQAGLLAVNYLIGQGHTKIGYMHGRRNTVVNEERYSAFQAGLAKAGLSTRAEWCVEGGFDYDQAKHAFRELASRRDLPTALVVANDLMALGVLEMAREMLIAVPQQLSVVGCDDIAFAAQSFPALTTVRLPQFQLGQLAMEELLRLFEAKGETDYRHQMLEVSLIKRQSVASPTQVVGAPS
jgi:LacI family transcriptional regulator